MQRRWVYFFGQGQALWHDLRSGQRRLSSQQFRVRPLATSVLHVLAELLLQCGQPSRRGDIISDVTEETLSYLEAFAELGKASLGPRDSLTRLARIADEMM